MDDVTAGASERAVPPVEVPSPERPRREPEPVPAWLDETVDDFGAPQATIDALVLRLGFQPMARLIADRPALRAAVIVEYRQQCAELRRRLLDEEWHV
jgi:hypothetical protein